MSLRHMTLSSQPSRSSYGAARILDAFNMRRARAARRLSALCHDSAPRDDIRACTLWSYFLTRARTEQTVEPSALLLAFRPVICNACEETWTIARTRVLTITIGEVCFRRRVDVVS